MAREPGSDRVPALRWRTHSPYECDVFEPVELFGLKIVPPSFAHPLPQQFDRRLCAIHFFLWHVHVVDEHHDELLPVFGPEMALPSFSVDLGLHGQLQLVGGGLPRERSAQVRVLLVQVVRVQLVYHVDGLPSTSRPRHQKMELALHEGVKEVVVPH